jgi:hypothetical protein
MLNQAEYENVKNIPYYATSLIHGGSGLHNRLEYAVWTHVDAGLAAAAFFSISNDHMLVKPDIHFPQYTVFTFIDTVPAGFAFACVRPYMLCPVSSRFH